MKKIIPLFIVLLLGNSVYAADNIYGLADFTRNDYIPRDGLVEFWNMDTGTKADMLGGLGNFENWNSSVGSGCTTDVCPVGWTCACTTNLVPNVDIRHETSKIWKSNSSAFIGAGYSSGDSSMSITVDLKANTAYQLLFNHMMVVDNTGTTLVTIENAGEYYIDYSDSWGAGPAYISAYPVLNTWIRNSVYIVNDAVSRPGTVITLMQVHTHALGKRPSAYIDNVQLIELDNTVIHGQMSHTLTPDVYTDPVFGAAQESTPKTADGPSGSSGMTIRDLGGGGYVSCSDTGDVFDPCVGGKECKMSIAVSGRDPTADTWSTMLVKGDESWTAIAYDLVRNTADVVFDFSNDGTTYTTLTDSDAIYSGQKYSIVATYDGTAGNGNAISTLKVNNRTAITDATGFSPLYDDTVGLLVGGIGEERSWERLAFYNKNLSTIEISKWMNPYFPATNYGNGFYVITCSQAASHATCGTNLCRTGTPDACQAEGTGVMAVFNGFTEELPNNGFNDITGTDDEPVFTDWSTYEEPGYTELTAYRADTFDGNISMRFHNTAAGSAYGYAEQCVNTTHNPYYISGKFKGNSLNEHLTFSFTTYKNANCARTSQNILIVDDADVPEEWTEYAYLYSPADPAVHSMRLNITTLGGDIGSDLLVDNLSVKPASYRTPWVENPPASTTTYNVRDYKIHNTLSDYDDKNSRYIYSAGFCTGGWVYTDWDGDSTVAFGYLLRVEGSGAGYNNAWEFYAGPSVFTFTIYDNAAAFKSNSKLQDGTTWSASSWKYFEGCTSNTGTIVCRWYNKSNSTWYTCDTGGGVGTGILSAQDDELTVGNDGFGTNADVYFSKIFIAPYSATFTNKYFNNGNPPVNGVPY